MAYNYPYRGPHQYQIPIISVPDKCFCCGLPRTTLEVNSWSCTFEELEKAADENCNRCRFYVMCINAYELVASRDIVDVKAGQAHCELTIKAVGGTSRVSFEIYTLPGEISTRYQGIQERGTLPGQTSSDVSFRTAKGWIEDCTVNHPECSHVIEEGSKIFEYPKRILGLSDGRVRLIEHLKDRPQYACLSHCWGPVDEVVKTTNKDNVIKKFQDEIPWTELTKTFQDAIDACRRLGINYIWIDSLCIIQDSDDDWREESAKMADIYENAFLTIAATRSNKSSIGCYATTDAQHLSRYVPQHNVYVRTPPPSFPTTWSNDGKPDIWPLFSRGWIYQEIRLCRRLLHFCPQELVWQCRSVRKSESARNDEDFVNSRRQLQNTMYHAVPYIKLMGDPRKLWWRTVQEYSQLNFTFEKDKLPALGALAQRMGRLKGGDRYLAGLWEKTLLLDLMWMTWPAPSRGTIRPDVWRAPTWSWASLNGQVMWESRLDDTLSSVKVLDIQYVSMGPAHLGDISTASITLYAPLVQTTLKELRHTKGVLSKITDAVIADNKFDYDLTVSGPHQVFEDTQVFLLPIGVCELNEHHEALVLRQQPKSGSNTGTENYERIGLVELEHRELNEINMARYTRMRNRVHESLEDIVREERDAKLCMERMSKILTDLPHSEVILV